MPSAKWSASVLFAGFALRWLASCASIAAKAGSSAFERDVVGKRRPCPARVLVARDDAPQNSACASSGTARFGKRSGARDQPLPLAVASQRNRLIVTGEAFQRSIEPPQRVAATDQRVGVVGRSASARS